MPRSRVAGTDVAVECLLAAHLEPSALARSVSLCDRPSVAPASPDRGDHRRLPLHCAGHDSRDELATGYREEGKEWQGGEHDPRHHQRHVLEVRALQQLKRDR